MRVKCLAQEHNTMSPTRIILTNEQMNRQKNERVSDERKLMGKQEMQNSLQNPRLSLWKIPWKAREIPLSHH